MPRPKRSEVPEVSGIRAELMERAQRALSRSLTLEVERELYDFTAESARLEGRLEALRAGRPVVVGRHELPRELVTGWPRVWAFTVDAEGGVMPAVLGRAGLA